jgi:regulator of protease activity HflC (stomatin/prohibitin superfamily)
MSSPYPRTDREGIFFLNWIKILNEYERGVIFRLGRLLPKPKGPGLIFVFSPIDKMVKISLRLVALDVPPQDVITRDNVSVKVNAVLFFRVVHPTKAVVEVQDFLYATSQLAQTTLRSVLGQVELDDLLAHRSMGHQGHHGGSQTRRFASGDAARDSETSRGRA